MPWRSEQQRKWGNSASGRAALGAKGVSEFNAASRGLKLPKRTSKSTKLSRQSKGLLSLARGN